MAQLLYEIEAPYKGQFFEIQFLRNRLDSQFNSANKFSNAFRRVNRLCVGEPGNYGMIPVKRKEIFVLFKNAETRSRKPSALLSMCTGRGGESRRGKSG
jgi:hypothetical protein